jgi:hypothetical protein
MLSSGIKEVVEKRYGQSVRYPVECEALASDISKCTGRTISASTIKRLWGFIDGASSARSYTLDTLAEYCDYGCFEDLVQSFNPMEPASQKNIKILSMDEITVGNEITIFFGSKGHLKLALNNARSFLVLDSSDCDLKEGDIFNCVKIEVGLPMFIRDWCRRELNLGSYTIAKLTGVSSISVTPKP